MVTQMFSLANGRRFPGAVAIALALITTLALAAPVLARPGGNAGGNSDAAAACENGGYVDWTDSAGNGFRNEGDCVSYAARGGTLVPVEVSPFSVSYLPSGSSGFQATVTGSGLEPDSSVDLVLTWGSAATVTIGHVADSSGDVTFVASGACTSLGAPLTAVAAAGTPAGGAHTEYALPLPDASVCPPPA